MGHEAPTRAQVAAKAGWKARGSHLRNRLSELRTAGLIEYPRDGVIALTPSGAVAAPAPDMAVGLVDSIRAALNGPQREVFDGLIGAGELTRDELAQRVRWDPKGSHLRNRLSELSAMEIVDYPSRGAVTLQPWIR